MDVRCEKCQTEYELDEARLKPGGVTVKCTNCGHMFKIRKRSATNVGAPAVVSAQIEPARSRPVSQKPLSSLDSDDPTAVATKAAPPGPLDSDGPTIPERQWLIRLENGEQKSCRELAMLQQWIVAGVVTRESLISRTGKTWKRLGDVGELAQYFTIADEARATRDARPTNKPITKSPAPTMLGVGPQAAGGTILPDDDEDLVARATTGSFQQPSKPRPSTPPPPPARAMTTPPPRPPVTAPPAPGPKKPESEKSWAQMPQTASDRSTGNWASQSPPPSAAEPVGPQGPFGGKVAAISDEPAFASKSFAGKVRTEPGDDRVFSSQPIKRLEDDNDDEMFPSRRGSRGGMLLVVVALLVIGAAATVVYMFAFRKSGGELAAKPATDAALLAVTADAAAQPSDGTTSVEPIVTGNPVAAVLGGDVEDRLRAAVTSTEDPGIKAHVMLALAQTLDDLGNLATDRTAADKAKKESKQLVLDAATLAQKALKARPDDAAASVAMAETLRLQGKAAKDIKRYIDGAIASKDWSRDATIATALVLARDGKLEDAAAALRGLDTDASDVRPKFHLALLAFQQNKPADARPLVEQVLATQPEHTGAKALQARLATSVAKTDPLPPEEPKNTGSAKTPPDKGPTNPPPDKVPTALEGYDVLIKQANQAAESANCVKAIELYQKAIEIKPGSVDALTGMGYCHIEAKQFSSAFSKFRAALAISPRYEPALWGIAQAYQQQGRKQDAIDSYKAYLEVYPGAAKATKQLERLGESSGATPPTPTPETPPPTTPTPTPTPTPAPADNGAQ